MSSESTKTKCTNEEISKLQIELKNEQHKNAILKDRATRAEDERDSLHLALKLLMQDQSIDNINPSTKTKDQGQGNCWNTVPKTRNRTISSNITSNVNGNATGRVAECTWCQNNFLVLDDLNESCRIIDEMQIKNRIGSDGSNEGKDKSPASKHQQARVQNNKKTVIVGDSIVKGLQQHKLSKAAKQNVGVKCFPGATVGDDMSDYIKPVLRRKPDTVMLHVGTNNATNKEASEIVNDIDKLCQEVKEIDPNVEIILSELTNREDNAKAKTTVQEVNRLLADYCIATNLNLIIHNNNILSKVPTLYSKISDTEPKEPSCSIEKIIPQTKCENSITFLQSLKGFRVGYLNIASLVKHVDELKIYLEKEPLDVLSINETRLDEIISTDTVSIPGYNMVAKNRNRQGGGVAIYHRSILNLSDSMSG
ncbi:RNA-directed DNA polymerase from transposon BS [Paramuricea clavata]|uniref:RNA-directed DNA polymerase from transposon BS n=1 Tax=Paramuricea clavata TaxID=317549 RepID=A0A7D9HBL8_PARCT|nr:RNA-directed DNA polymerase from transposon BS [Paramuricea clavata]